MVAQNTGFINHAKLAFVTDVTTLGALNGYEHKANFLEQIGHVATWHITGLPRKVYQALSDPRVLSLAITIFTNVAVQYAFYPAITANAAREAIQMVIPEPWKVKLALYILSQFTIVGFGMRALGRFTNDTLMNAWYNPTANA